MIKTGPVLTLFLGSYFKDQIRPKPVSSEMGLYSASASAVLVCKVRVHVCRNVRLKAASCRRNFLGDFKLAINIQK